MGRGMVLSCLLFAAEFIAADLFPAISEFEKNVGPVVCCWSSSCSVVCFVRGAIHLCCNRRYYCGCFEQVISWRDSENKS
jgi:hypothetical protein